MLFVVFIVARLFVSYTCSRARFIQQNFPDRCIFNNILKFVKNPEVEQNKLRLVSWKGS